jgi:membrane-associated protease RseP (regulator of RpoE activity)
LSEPPSPWPEGPHLPLRRPLLELLPSPGEPPQRAPERPRYALAAALFLLTLLSTITLGPVMYMMSRTDVTTDLPGAWGVFLSLRVITAVWHDPALLRIGLSFSCAAMTILFCHEMGHYIACRRYGLACTLPYFLPVPVNFGTFGAFIKIKQPIRNKRELFDVGVAGPIAGFVALIPFLLYGIAHSTPVALPHVDPSVATGIVEAPGKSLAILLAARYFHGPLPPGTYLNLHPMALGAWLGLFATSLNLLPLSQLDGGHILYAAGGRLQRRLAIPLWLGLGLLGWLWPGWIVWTLVVLVIGLYHPPVWDEREPLDPRRRAIAVLALVIFVLSFMPVPLDILPV